MYASAVGSRKSFAAQSTAVIMIIVLLLAAMPALVVSAAETAFYAPAAVSVQARSAWSNPTYVFDSDDQYASTNTNKYMRLSQFHIAAIPAGATINGISVGVEGKTAGGRQVKVQISGDNGATWSTAFTSDLAPTDGLRMLGGASVLWGRTWTPANFANASFVMRVTPVGLKSSGTVYLDQVKVKVYYTPAIIALTVQADPQTKHYGYPEPAYTYQVTSGALLPGDSFSGQLVRDPGDVPGQYQINQGTLTAGPKYSITYVPDFLTIDKAPLTITAQSYWKLSADPDVTTFAAIYTGFVLGENENTALSSLPTCSLPPGTDQSVPDVYPITCTGAAADNYEITYAAGTLTVKSDNNVPTDITLTPAAAEENHLAGYTVGAFGNNDPDTNDPFAYTLCGGTDDASFEISGASLKTKEVLNYEAKNSLSICVQVDDGFHGTYQETMTVGVLDLPETFRSLGSQDGWVLESAEATSVGGSMNSAAQTLRVGDDAANRQYRSILSFATGSLPDTAVITQMTLKIRRTPTITGSNPFLTYGNLLVDGRRGFFGKSSLLQIGDFQAAATKAAWRTIPNTASAGWYSTTLAGANIKLINRTGPTQMRLRFQKDDNNDMGADYLSFYSGNAVLANRPVLEVQYYLP